ncbi:phosphatidylinositol-3-phosphatase SAC1-like [Sycon ciliatum]|uniref:phosphatidylinositol-3-phosphatase SAC1-like n=1 Tax=Sycon ciliatum TaxID=27933 RepID=UPI0031F6214C|eukprot:scpid72725/ scgid21349/ Phosphatidylinositide phosphatase SAC1; Suppressor of actin mutations 1-like protein
MALDKVHPSLKLYTSNDFFYLVPNDRSDILRIDRVSHDIQLINGAEPLPPTEDVQDTYGLFGIIRLLAGPYMVIITGRRRVGTICGHDVWKITSTDVVSFARGTRHLTDLQERHNREYLAMVHTVLATDGFYYSTTYDVTHRSQQLYNTSPEFAQMPLHERADQRFVWNTHLLRDLSVEPDMHRFAIPILHGFITISECTINQKAFTFALISRRSTYRAGTRFFVRGVDRDGHAANFVETEQLVTHGKAIASFVQIRGSIPLFWSQRPSLQYAPPPKLVNTELQKEAFRRHCETQEVQYGYQVLVNLINQRGREKPLADAFDAHVSLMSNPRVKYDAFDFHHECRNMQWQNLDKLITRLRPEHKQFGYFAIDAEDMVTRRQEGVFRTNCIDCLDRTNVVQSMLARITLNEQLQDMGILRTGEATELHANFEKLFKNVWADNADACSVQYSGTGALKTDFTRTGKRTIFGLMRDGWNSMVRYYKNNFADGFRQDAIDLFLGNHVVELAEGASLPSPLERKYSWRYRVLPLVLLFVFSMLIFCMIIPATSLRAQFIYCGFWIMAIMFTLFFMYKTGPDFVNQPRLRAKDKNV